MARRPSRRDRRAETVAQTPARGADRVIKIMAYICCEDSSAGWFSTQLSACTDHCCRLRSPVITSSEVRDQPLRIVTDRDPCAPKFIGGTGLGPSI